MKIAVRVACGILGLLFVVNWLGWVADPASAAEGLGMPLLDGVGRSTQIGDIGALFAAAAVMLLVGAVREHAAWLQAVAILIGGAAVMRTLAWAVHGAEFTGVFIAVEVVTAAVALLGARVLGSSPA